MNEAPDSVSNQEQNAPARKRPELAHWRTEGPEFYRLATLDFGQENEGLDLLRECWNKTYGSVSESLRDGEAAVLDAEPGERFLRLSTGGWSENEMLISAFMDSWAAILTWEMNARGGLWIFKYRVEVRNGS